MVEHMEEHIVEHPEWAVKKRNRKPRKKDFKLFDPRQQKFLAFFYDPKSETFNNSQGSARRAGYSKDYARNITFSQPEWFVSEAEIMNKKYSSLLEDAEVCIDEMVHLDVKTDGKRDPALVKIKQDTAKFVAARLGKKHWSERSELAGVVEQPISIKQSFASPEEAKKYLLEILLK